MKKRLPPYARAVVEKRRAGEHIGLLVVALHDWQAGLWFDGRPEVCRVMIPADLAVDAVDWSCLLALDVVLCGSAPDGVFRQAVWHALAFGAASCWGEFDDGLQRMERVGELGVVAVEGPVPVRKLSPALRDFRAAALALSIGAYGSRVFDAAREAMFGPLRAELLSSLEGSQ